MSRLLNPATQATQVNRVSRVNPGDRSDLLDTRIPLDRPLRISLLTHSTLPRGGVVHALELGDALADAGHHVRLLAPVQAGESLFRKPKSPRCRFIGIPATPVSGDLEALVKQRINDWMRYFETSADAFDTDIFHSQDSISANALANLLEQHRLRGFVRTVHHLDHFTNPSLAAWQQRGYLHASHVCCVSQGWKDTLQRDEGIHAALVCNGVDRARFSPVRDESDVALEALRFVANSGDTKKKRGPVFLSVGGIEARKNTLNALAAYTCWRQMYPADRIAPHGQWWIAGGASLLDHGAYGQRFRDLAQAAGLSVGSTLDDATADIVLLGRVADAQMPALFRAADALLFPSLVEGFGLVVLEALSVGTPVITSRIPPFTEYLPDAAVVWADPMSAHSIAAAMCEALVEQPSQSPSSERAQQRREAGFAVAEQFSWARSANQHIDLYRSIAMPEMHFRVRWPDQSLTDCYSPSLVIKDFLAEGERYPLTTFVDKTREALAIASDRVKAKYGFACSAAADEMARIESCANRFREQPDACVTVESFS